MERDVPGDDADADGRGARVLERSHPPPLAAPPAAVPVAASRRAVVAIHSAPPPGRRARRLPSRSRHVGVDRAASSSPLPLARSRTRDATRWPFVEGSRPVACLAGESSGRDCSRLVSCVRPVAGIRIGVSVQRACPVVLLVLLPMYSQCCSSW